MKKIINQETGIERAFYNSIDTEFDNIKIKGIEDGESAFKECRNIIINNSEFQLRYPLWHINKFVLKNSIMHIDCRASLWYCQNGSIDNVNLDGVKAVRACSNLKITNSKFVSEEFGWKSDSLSLSDSTFKSQYFLFDSQNIKMKNCQMNGKYSFQYMNNVIIENCTLDTKDAFWHSKNVTIKNSIVKGEYLAWYSENVTFINCTIIGIQPFCYCRNLKLINCSMEGCTLAFEYSEVDADTHGHIKSIKNIAKGQVIVDAVDEIINENQVYPCSGKVIIRK